MGRHSTGERPIDQLRNLGPQSARVLATVGLHTEADLLRLGALEAYRLVLTTSPFTPSANLLWALEAALLDVDWPDLPEQRRADLESELAMALTPTPPGAQPDEALIARIRSDLATAADPQRAVGAQAYMKSAMPFRGVPVPAVRSLARAAVTDHPLPDAATWNATVRQLWDGAAYREERYAALALARDPRHRAYQDVTTLPLYRHLVETGAWWDLVDETAHRVCAVLDADPEPVGRSMRAWAHDGNLWVRRTAILSQLARKERTDPELLGDVLAPNLADAEFFIAKACGWALRQYARVEPDWVRAYCDAHDLRPLTRREALKHL